MTQNGGSMNGIPARIDRLKTKILSQPRFASVEQAQIITESYKKHNGKPRIIQRAYALKDALDKMTINVEPEELIVGNRTAGVRSGVVFPEAGSSWVDREFDTLPTRPQDRFEVNVRDKEIFENEIEPYWAGRSLEDILKKNYGQEISEISRVVKINQMDHAQGHICPDCKAWLETGPAGLKSIAREKQKTAKGNERLFYESVIIVMDGAVRFMQRYADTLHELMAQVTDPELVQSLRVTADNCRNLAVRPAETFHEALQSLWFLFTILHMESNASSFSPGRLDMILLPYYERSKAAGMTRDEALTLIECLWLKFNEIVYMRNANSAKYFAGFPIGFNIALGGQDRDGNDVSNDLTFLFLDAQDALGLPQPNLSVRLHENSGNEVMTRAVEVVSKGSGMPQFFNDKAVVPALEELGITHEDALDYAIVGCVELTTQGNNLGWSDAAMFNLNKALELTLNGGVDLITGEKIGPDYGSLATYESFEALEESFDRQLDYFIDRMIKACEEVEEAHMTLLPTPFLSAVVRDCMENGMDVTAGGAHYNLSGIQMIQVANLADSMAALKKLVYDEKKISPERLLKALQTDFREDELCRTILLNKAPKYGNDVEWTDELGAKWAEAFKQKLSRYTNYRGGKYHTGMYTVSAHVPMGENVGASPDGRYSGAPLADGGLSPVYGRDLAGPTAVLRSVSRLDKTLTSNGGLLNMKFLPEFFSTDAGIQKFVQFLRGFVDLEIPHIQFNVVREEDLLAAKKNPEAYRSLTVRVAGYTAYFTELAGELQDEIIARTAYGDI